MSNNLDIFTKGRIDELFVGRPFSIDYTKANILTSDYWKFTVEGIPQGCFLLAFYEGEGRSVEEALLLRALCPTKLPNDSHIISSMIEFYKDDVEVASRAGSRKESDLDAFTKHEFSFSGIECRILGSFYKFNEEIVFGADTENFYSANNYKIYKATGSVLETIVNQRENIDIDYSLEFTIGKVRYSSARRFQQASLAKPGNKDTNVAVRINPGDFLGKRTALFGMTRTGKSNTVKKIIQATIQISSNLIDNNHLPIGQIIFDINGEYANPNEQDEGTAIYDQYPEQVIRYSIIEQKGFEEMKINFYYQMEQGFNFISEYLRNKGDKADYVQNFLAISLDEPETEEDRSAIVRYERLKAAYLCCLYKAGFKPPPDFKVKFKSCKEIDEEIRNITPKQGIDLKQATTWFIKVWEMYDNHSFFQDYIDKKGKEWADEDLKALMIFLSKKKSSKSTTANISGYLKLKTSDLTNLHTATRDTDFTSDISKQVRQGRIIIVDLSRGSADLQAIFSANICDKIFRDSLTTFTQNKTNNVIQFYFEEAHNLFPRKEDKDLTDIYNRIAKEGAKLKLGMIYATQEVSSISSNILKNTQNWFIAHLNNDDELRELRKYYDFADFMDSIIRFSSGSDKGFVRMKTYTNPFVVPVQIDRFTVKKNKQ